MILSVHFQVKFRSSVYSALRGYHGFPVIQDWASEYVKRRLDKQSFEGQPAGSITTGSNTPNQENSDSSVKRVIDLEVLVAAFIATATFAAAFAMPGGYISDGPNQGMATLAGRAAFTTFVITNTIAFSFSTTALFLQYDTSALSDREKVSAGALIYLAMLAMVLAFASGTYVVLTRTIGLAIVPWVVCGCFGSRYIIGFIGDPDHSFGMVRVSTSRLFPPKGMECLWDTLKELLIARLVLWSRELVHGRFLFCFVSRQVRALLCQLSDLKPVNVETFRVCEGRTTRLHPS